MTDRGLKVLEDCEELTDIDATGCDKITEEGLEEIGF
jgi:hypothetical protein